MAYVTPPVGIGLVIGSMVVLLGAGDETNEENEAPDILAPVSVEPPLEEMAALADKLVHDAEERLQATAIVEAADHYGIDIELAAAIHRIAREEGIDPDLAFGLVRVESRFDPEAVSHAGAVGLAQLMPATAKSLSPRISHSGLRDVERNLRLGMRYLRKLIDHYDGDLRLALTAYNRGPGTVARALKAGKKPYNGYARLVLKHRLPETIAEPNGGVDSGIYLAD